MFEVAFYEKDWHHESGDVFMTRKLDVVPRKDEIVILQRHNNPGRWKNDDPAWRTFRVQEVIHFYNDSGEDLGTDVVSVILYELSTGVFRGC